MFLIQKISADPYQKQTLVLEDGTTFSITLYFIPMQYGWFITQLTYPTTDFVLNGLRISNSPNMLNQFANLIPFGLCCLSAGNREPSQLQDFSSGASKLYVLSQTEVIEYQDYLENNG